MGAAKVGALGLRIESAARICWAVTVGKVTTARGPESSGRSGCVDFCEATESWAVVER